MTVSHVFDRLRVKGINESVQAHIPFVKEEETETDKKTTKAFIEHTWNVVTLISITMPSNPLVDEQLTAVVRGSNEAVHNIDDSDELRPYIKAPEDEPSIHPCLDLSGTPL